MILSPDIQQSITENQYDLNGSWMWSDVDIYTEDYREILQQPISLEAYSLQLVRFKAEYTTITIRKGPESNSELIFVSSVQLIDEMVAAETAYHNNLNGIQGGTSNEYYHLTNTEHEFVKNMATITKEYTGFFTTSNVGVTYSDVNRTVTLSGPVSAFWRGVQVPFLFDCWVSPPHNTGMTTSQYLYYNGTSIVWSSTPWTFDMLMIALVAIDANGVVQFCIREPHGMMQWESHKELHETLGTYIKATDGGDLSNFTTNSTANRRPYISQTIVNDEDIATTLPSLITNQYTLFNLSGTGSVGSYTVNNADIVLQNANRPYFNQFSGGVWSNVQFANNSYGAIFVLALPATLDTLSQNKRFIFVQPQANGNLTTIQALTVSSLNLSNLTNLSPEYVFFSKIIIQYTASNWSITRVDKLTGTKVNQSSSNVTGLITVATDGTSVSGLGLPTSPITLVNVGTSGTYTKVTTNTKGQVVSGGVLVSSDIPNLDASKITTGVFTTARIPNLDASWITSGTFDVARIPVLPSQVPQVTTNLASLTVGQQNLITSGSVVTTSDDGWRYVYSGTGSKTVSGSYVQLADITPEWTAIGNRPTNVSYWNNDSGYLTTTTGDARYSLTGHTHYQLTNSRVGVSIYNNDDALGMSAKNALGTSFFRMFNSPSAPRTSQYYATINMPETTTGAFAQYCIAFNGSEFFFGGGAGNSDSVGWKRVWMQDDFSGVDIAHWNTGYSHSQTTGNPHGTTYSQVGAAPASHGHNQIEIVSSSGWITDALNSKQASGNYVTLDTIQLVTGAKVFTQNVTVSKDYVSDSPGFSSYYQWSNTNVNRHWIMQQGATKMFLAYEAGAGWNTKFEFYSDGSFNATGNIFEGNTLLSDKYLGKTAKASDSDLLDGIDSSRFVYGTNGYATIDIGANFATINKSGFYNTNAATDSPVASTWAHVIHSNHSGDTNWAFQIAANFGTGTGNSEGYHVRTKTNGTYGGWRKVWTSLDFGASDITNWNTAYAHSQASHDYLPMSRAIGGSDGYTFSYDETMNAGKLNLTLWDDNDGSEAFQILNNGGNFIAGFYSNRISDFYSIYENGVALSSKYAPLTHGHDFSWISGRTKDVGDISARIDSGWYNHQPTTTALGWPANGSWWHLMSSTHENGSNYYAMQLAADFYAQDFRIRSTNGNGLTAWSTIWTSSNFTPSSKSDVGHKHDRLYREDDPSPYYLRHSWTMGQWYGNGWRITNNNDSGDSQTNIHTVAVNFADFANDSNNFGGQLPSYYAKTNHSHVLSDIYNCGDYSAPVYEGIWPSGVTKGNGNFAVLWRKNNYDLYLNASNSLYFQTTDGTTRTDKLTITPSIATFSIPVNINGNNVLTELDSSNFLIGSNGRRAINSTGSPLHSPKAAGFYSQLNDSINGTTGGASWTHLINCRGSDWTDAGQYTFQIASSFSGDGNNGWGNETYAMRTITAGTPNSWKILWHSGNLVGDRPEHHHSADRAWGNLTDNPFAGYTPANFIAAGSLAGYLPLSGGDMNSEAVITLQSPINGFKIKLHPGDGTSNNECYIAVGRVANGTGPVSRIFPEEMYVNGTYNNNGSKVWHSGNLSLDTIKENKSVNSVGSSWRINMNGTINYLTTILSIPGDNSTGKIVLYGNSPEATRLYLRDQNNDDFIFVKTYGTPTNYITIPFGLYSLEICLQTNDLNYGFLTVNGDTYYIRTSPFNAITGFYIGAYGTGTSTFDIYRIDLINYTGKTL